MNRKTRFTLIELLIVVGIIAILMSLLLPALARAKYQARHAGCVSNQKQLIVSMVTYASDNNNYYASPNRWLWVQEDEFKIPFNTLSWTVADNYAHNAWAGYVDGPFGNYKDLTVRANGIAVCPQGIVEVPWTANDSDTMTHSNNKALYNFYTYLKNQGTLDQRRRQIKRRVGQPLIPGPNKPTFSDAPLVSDHCQIVQGGIYTGLGWNGKYAFSTNHIYGGDRVGPIMHFSAMPVYWGTVAGKGEANYGMEDGSVRRFGGLSFHTKDALAYEWPMTHWGRMDRPWIPLELKD